jgi:hypothetical protein
MSANVVVVPVLRAVDVVYVPVLRVAFESVGVMPGMLVA